MFKVIRNLHLATGMFALAFLLMYGISALQMAHRKWFALDEKMTLQTLTVEKGMAGARDVRRALPMAGELTNVRPSADRVSFWITRPGIVHQVTYRPNTGEALVETHSSGLRGALNRIHQIQGTWHEDGIINVWAVVLGLVSAGLVLLGATGLYLWFQDRRERGLGAILLSAGSGLALVLMLWMRAG